MSWKGHCKCDCRQCAYHIHCGPCYRQSREEMGKCVGCNHQLDAHEMIDGVRVCQHRKQKHPRGGLCPCRRELTEA